MLGQNAALLPFFSAVTMLHNMKMMLKEQYSHFLETEILLLINLFQLFIQRLLLA